MKRAILLSVMVLAACNSTDDARECSVNADCIQGGISGQCLPSPESGSSFCAYPDSECDSGLRWGVAAGDDLAKDCVDGEAIDAGAIDASIIDAGAIDAAQPDASPGTWTKPTVLQNVNSDKSDTSPSISSDGLELYFTSTRSGGLGLQDIYVATRASQSVAFGTPINLAAVNSTGNERNPEVSASGLELFFDRAGEFFVSTRATTAAAWGTPTKVTLSGTIKSVQSPSITADGLTLYFTQAGEDSCGGISGPCTKAGPRLVAASRMATEPTTVSPSTLRSSTPR